MKGDLGSGGQSGNQEAQRRGPLLLLLPWRYFQSQLWLNLKEECWGRKETGEVDSAPKVSHSRSALGLGRIEYCNLNCLEVDLSIYLFFVGV